MKYTSTGLSDSKAQRLGSFIEKRFNGIVTPEELIEAAKNKSSSIHNLFDWDNTSAAAKWRIHQARMYIACLFIKIDGKETRAYHNLSLIKFSNEERKYISTDQARKSADLWEQVLDQALNEAKAWCRRFDQYKELSLITKAIIKTERKLYGKTKETRNLNR